VLADWAERKQRIWEEVQRAASEAGGEPLPDDDLLETVTGLVEEPFGVAGHFDGSFLELPPEVLISEMRGHQKYFSVRDGKTQRLLPAFVAVSNTRVKDPAVSRRGYERVLRARLSDGKFFFDEDRKVKLADRIERLARRTFMDKLGSELERVERIRELSLWLHGSTGKGEPALLRRARRVTQLPIAVGFGISLPGHVSVLGGLADAAVVGSALVSEIEKATTANPNAAGIDAAAAALADRIGSLKDAGRSGLSRRGATANRGEVAT